MYSEVIAAWEEKYSCAAGTSNFSRAIGPGMKKLFTYRPALLAAPQRGEHTGEIYINMAPPPGELSAKWPTEGEENLEIPQ